MLYEVKTELIYLLETSVIAFQESSCFCLYKEPAWRWSLRRQKLIHFFSASSFLLFIKMWTHCLILFAVLPLAWSHGQLTSPRPAQTDTCPQLGGDSSTCPGPCDPNSPPSSVTATFRRGQTITVRYQRNNHGPGGFLRVTMVPPGDMMDMDVHTRNAFHFSCWGARLRIAEGSDLDPVEGVSLVGVDNSNGFHSTQVRIPTVIPDGEYVFGWAWYGGIGDSQVENTNRPTITPGTSGFFQDYWTCSRVRISGGPMRDSYRPVFVNDMRQFSPRGCMSSVNRLGICTSEPCEMPGSFRRPFEFRRGRPDPLTPDMFVNEPSRVERFAACQCVGRRRCRQRDADGTNGRCVQGVGQADQSDDCVDTCCGLCKDDPAPRVCTRPGVVDGCDRIH